MWGAEGLRVSPNFRKHVSRASAFVISHRLQHATLSFPSCTFAGMALPPYSRGRELEVAARRYYPCIFQHVVEFARMYS